MSKISKKTTVFVTIALVLIILAGLGTGLWIHFTSPVLEKGNDKIVTIKEGMRLKEISGMLEKDGLIKNSTVFILWAMIKGYSRMIKAGEYRLNPAMPPGKIMQMLTRGEIVAHVVTIPEGFSIEQIADVLSSSGIIDKEKFLLYTGQNGIEKKYGLEGPGLEGYLYPDTYKFALGLNARSIVDNMIRRFKEVIAPFRGRIAESGMSLHEIITLASIVEKETGRADERPLIASVFFNRLRRNMRLESDPTVIYGIKNFSGNLKKTDLTAYSPYNTYVIRGLPPGPIANPGLDSIKAVLYPARTKFLYFVSKNDGSHYFSDNLRDHNRAVYTYQKKRHR